MTIEFRQQAQDHEKYDRMVKLLGNAATKEDMEQAALLFIMDLSYPRADIVLAIKAVEREKGW